MNTVTLTVTDNNSNVSICPSQVSVEDNVLPECVAQDIIVQLDASGQAIIDVTSIDNGSSDACGILSRTIDVTDFDCTNIGMNTVTLTVTDNNNNVSTCESEVSVEDNVLPECVAQDITVQLDASGQTVIDVMSIDNGSSDACGILTRTIDLTDFDCTNIGMNTVTLTVTDNNNNVSTCPSQAVSYTHLTLPTNREV